MGCSASKHNISDSIENPEHNSSDSKSNCSSSPLPTKPLSLVHHPPLRKGDTHHLVSLTSTTYGSLLLIHPPNLNGQDLPDHSPSPSHSPLKHPDERGFTPDSVINTWELMDGLDDDNVEFSTPFNCNSAISDRPITSPSKNESVVKSSGAEEKENLISSSSSSLTKPLWHHLSEETMLAKLDHNVGQSYRRALSSRQLGSKITKPVGSSPLCSSFSNDWVRLPGTEDRIVIYFTSLRGIRKTYEDCCTVRTIFRGFSVAIDERDISMDSSYKNELKTALGKKTVSLPQVFIRGKNIGGAEDIKQMNEIGELARILDGFHLHDSRFVCEICGDARFLPCPNCNGSRKVFEEDEYELRRCPHCNENGLIRCPSCCS